MPRTIPEVLDDVARLHGDKAAMRVKRDGSWRETTWTEARAEANLAEAVVNLQRALGRTLDVFKITIADAKTGSVTRDTNIPGTTTTGQLFDPKMLSNQ